MLQCIYRVITVWLSMLYLNTAMEYSSGRNMAEHKTTLNNIPTHGTATDAQYDDDD